MQPVLYVTGDSYAVIIQDDFSDCDLWYRSVYSGIPADVEWTFWQYSNRHRLQGYDGSERYIDMNVFNGTEDDLMAYVS
ncbi:lysozyme [Ruminococcaceae bacterium YRB3002]|nr:lysozyme [Ruminococcaceae bacterium YRB3002]